MHMADALVSPAVGVAAWAATAATVVYSAKKVREANDPAKVPLMGVLGAFIFAAQMLNFSIPGTGSSGHLGGGLILAVLLGPEAAFLVVASVLSVQALFFADGGLLALGCNIFNLGVFPAFVAYPLLFRPIVGGRWTRGRVISASFTAALASLLLGASGVVLETGLSGISSLPMATFAAVMLPIHTVIGFVEGAATASVVLFVMQAQPELLVRAASGGRVSGLRLRTVLVVLAMVAVLAGTVLVSFRSLAPDGLESSIARVTGTTQLVPSDPAPLREAAGRAQERTAPMPGYEGEAAGIVGAGITLAVAVLLGVVLTRRRSRRTASTGIIGSEGE